MNERGFEVAIVADDLTGAMDTAAPFASAGLSTRVVFDGGLFGVSECNADVLSLNTETRHVSDGEAGATVRAVVTRLLDAEPRILLKKIDSTLRGNVTAEIVAAARSSGRRHLVIAPAAPGQGRIVRMGAVFVHGVPLHQTAIVSDTYSPAPKHHLHELLRAKAPEITIHQWKRDAPRALAPDAGVHAYIADGETEADLAGIAQFALDHAEELLLVGAAGLGTALARALHLPSARPAVPPLPSRVVLFVVGSRTRLSGEQVSQLHRVGIQDILLPGVLPSECVWRPRIAAKSKGGTAFVLRPAQEIVASAADVARAVGRACAELVRELDVDTLVIVGGDTASAALHALDIRDATVAGEVAPGIAIGSGSLHQRPITIVTKSGGFGDNESLTEILSRLRMST
jgi:D-threonate/D-erythronate kinase